MSVAETKNVTLTKTQFM